MTSEPARRAEVLRIPGRDLDDVVERHDLCPWARGAREGGELAVAVLWGTPGEDAWVDAARELLARPATRVAMVVAPELAVALPALRAIRDRVAARITGAGVAEFHPEAALDLATPARLVPFVRRAPDPLLQLVPLGLLDSVRAAPPVVDRARQAQALGGRDLAPPRDVAARIATANHATVSAAAASIVATLDDIARDRRDAYARLGISGSRRP